MAWDGTDHDAHRAGDRCHCRITGGARVGRESAPMARRPLRSADHSLAPGGRTGQDHRRVAERAAGGWPWRLARPSRKAATKISAV